MPTITTTLSGFGQWVITDGNEGFDKSGVAVVPRGDFNYDQVKESIATLLRTLVNAPASQMQQYREAARRTAAAAAWEKFFVHYAQAYAKAIENAEGRLSF